MERFFRPWWYEVGHQRLLLRSLKDDCGTRTRVDVLFIGVFAMLLCDGYPRLSISLASAEQHMRIEQLGFETSEMFPAYVLSDEPFSFVHTPALVSWHEDTGDYWQPLAFGNPR